MSQTKKGSKSPGYDYWSRRPTKDTTPGRPAKKATHKKERTLNKRISKELGNK